MKLQKTKKTGLTILGDSVKKTPQSLWSAGKRTTRNLNALNPGEDLREEEKRKKKSGGTRGINPTQFMSSSERKKWDKLSDRKKEQFLRKERLAEEYKANPTMYWREQKAQERVTGGRFSNAGSAARNDRNGVLGGKNRNAYYSSYASTGKTSYEEGQHLSTIQRNGSGISRINIEKGEYAASGRQESFTGENEKTGERKNNVSVGNTSGSTTVSARRTTSSAVRTTSSAGNAAKTAGKTAAKTGTTAVSAAATGGISLAAEAGTKAAKKVAKKFREKMAIDKLHEKEAVRLAEQKQKKQEEAQAENKKAAASGTDSNGLSNKVRKAIETIVAFASAMVGGLLSVLSTVFITFIIAMLIIIVLVSFFSKTGGGGRQRMVEAALAEYEESDKNIGGAKYKDWYGFDGNWCGMFVAYCGDKCGYIKEGIIVKSASVSESKKWYEARGEFHTKESGYIPLPGDIIYFTNDASHMGIVIEYDEKTDHVITIEGNSGRSSTNPYHMGSHVIKGSHVRTAYAISGYASPAYPDEVDDLNGATNAEKVFNALVSQGYSEQAAAAVVGNLYREAGVDASGDIKLHSVNPSGSSIGIGQWKGGRKEAFLQYAADAGEPWPNTGLAVQINFMLRELSSNEWLWTSIGSEYGNDCHISLAEFKTLTDVEYATRVFCANYERCHKGDAALPYRTEKAKDAYAAFGGK